MATKADIENLNLVKFRSTCFPLHLQDAKLLSSLGMNLPRFEENALEILLGSKVLKRLRSSITFHSWPSVYEELTKRLSEAVYVPGVYFEVDGNIILIGYPLSSESPEEVEIKSKNTYLDSCINIFATYCSNYSFKVISSEKLKDGFIMKRLVVKFDKGSFQPLSDKDQTLPTRETSFNLDLSPSCRVKIHLKPGVAGTKVLRVSFDDKFGSEYEEAFCRAFGVNFLSKDQALKAAEFFLNLHADL